MNLETLRDYCLSLPGVTEELPFGPETLVFKVMGKVFLLTPLDELKMQFNVKCDPEKAMELREQYSFVQPGYHMNKKHWNTVFVNAALSSDVFFGWVKHSYDLVVNSLPRKVKEELKSFS